MVITLNGADRTTSILFLVPIIFEAPVHGFYISRHVRETKNPEGTPGLAFEPHKITTAGTTPKAYRAIPYRAKELIYAIPLSPAQSSLLK